MCGKVLKTEGGKTSHERDVHGMHGGNPRSVPRPPLKGKGQLKAPEVPKPGLANKAQSVVEPVMPQEPVRFRTTDMIGDRTGVGNMRTCSAVTKLVEYLTMNELRAMPREQLEAFHFSRIAMVVRGALDGLQFWRSDTGASSPFYGACPSLNGSAACFGDVRSQMRPMALGPGLSGRGGHVARPAGPRALPGRLRAAARGPGRD